MKVISKWDNVLPALDTNNRRIPYGPLYSKEEVIQILNLGEEQMVFTRKGNRDLNNLKLSIPQLIELIVHNFTNKVIELYKHSEWCLFKTDEWAASDVYLLNYCLSTGLLAKYFNTENSYYFKFFIGKDNKILGIISIHL